MDVQQIIAIVQLSQAYQQTKRALYATGEDRPEGDAEHSYQLALVAWYIANQVGGFNLQKIIQYALVHDLVEVYAGDTDAFTSDAVWKAAKKERETNALKQLDQNFTFFPDMLELIHQYEQKSDPESQLIWEIDKLLPVLNVYLDKGRTWQERNHTFQLITETLNRVVDKFTTMEPLAKAILSLLGSHSDYFPPANSSGPKPFRSTP
jgi:putative hydrolases of HD superfamily